MKYLSNGLVSRAGQFMSNIQRNREFLHTSVTINNRSGGV